MLSAHEFTAGAFKDTAPLSLILPRNEHEETVLIGRVEDAAAAVFLSERYTYEYFLTASSENWHGLIVPNVRIEVDEKSAFDPTYRSRVGTIIRTGTRLAIRARADRSSSASLVTLEDGLASTGEHKVGFSRWQVVIGDDAFKRVLWQVSLPAIANL